MRPNVYTILRCCPVCQRGFAYRVAPEVLSDKEHLDRCREFVAFKVTEHLKECRGLLQLHPSTPSESVQ